MSMESQAFKILYALNDPIIVVDRDGAVVFLNDAAQDFFSISFANAKNTAQKKGLFWRDLIPKTNVIFDLPQRVRRHHSSIGLHDIEFSFPQNKHVVKKPTYRMDVTAKPIDEKESENDMIVISFHPHHIADRLDGVMQQRESSRQVGSMTAMLAHEIKNPLAGIRGATQLIAPMLPKEERSWSDMILAESDRIQRLLARLEKFDDNYFIDHKPINIHKVLDHVITIHRGDESLCRDISTIYDPSLPPAFGDFDRLVQVFLNLLKNAGEALAGQDDGKIIVKTSYVSGVRLAMSEKNLTSSVPLMIEIEDNGPGIAEPIQQRLFEPFASARGAGRGLGLALCAKYIADHAGVIEAQSRPGKTVFRVLLPLH